jgi:hypothetical protein
VDTLGKILADDYISICRGISPSPDGPPYTKAASLDNFRRRWRFTEVKFIKDREVFRIDEHTALMTYEVKWRGQEYDRPPSSGYNRYILCWVQRNGGWFLKHMEAVSLPLPAQEPYAPLILLDPLTPLKVRANGS